MRAAKVDSPDTGQEDASSTPKMRRQKVLASQPETANSVMGSVLGALPRGLLVTTVWVICLSVVTGAVLLLGWIAGMLSEVVFPLFAAFLFTAALQPMHKFLTSHRWPDWLSALVCLIFLVFIVGGLLTLVGLQIASQWEILSTQLVDGLRELMRWLTKGPLHITDDQIDALLGGISDFMKSQQADIASLLASIGASILRFLTGLLLCLFAVFFFLKDGARLAKTMHGMVPKAARPVFTPAASAGWQSMVSYVRAAVAVAAVDGVGAGIGAMVLGSNLWVAIMALTFVCAFVPMLGALIAGAVGCIIVLATLGWVKAFIMLIIFIVVLETEVHVMQPWMLGRAVDIHPLLVLVSIAIGMVIAGIAGAVFAIPLVALIVGVIRAIVDQSNKDNLAVAN